MKPSFAARPNTELLEALYEDWRRDPHSVDGSWAAFFEGFELGVAQVPARRNGAVTAAPSPEQQTPAADVSVTEAVSLQQRVDGLVSAYRTLGHTLAQLDPLGTPRPEQPLLTLGELGFAEADLDRPAACRTFLGGKTLSLREMLARLQRTYAGHIGAEFMYLSSVQARHWLRDRLEARPEQPALEPTAQRKVLETLLDAEMFERFLHTRYVGQKRFSLEGGEGMMVALEAILERAGRHGVLEIVMGMAHRGRLNVLANFLKKSLKTIFTEFSENYIPQHAHGDGDVKYHLGFEAHRDVGPGRSIYVQLAANPSHLEFVNPVVEGKARARQRIVEDTQERRRVLPLLIHGDAAVIGQGVVPETLNLSQLPGYRTGGTVHVVINNQIGFTTLPADARSSLYCTDVAKMVEAPVLHVNGDDPEAVAFCAELALDFRQEFGRDVFVDVYCYRRYGHNEGDEPSFTQPDLYAKIARQPSVATLYQQRLVEAGRLTAEDAKSLNDGYGQQLESALQEAKGVAKAEETPHQDSDSRKESLAGSHSVFQPPYSHEPVRTGITPEQLERIVWAVTHVPAGFNLLPKLKRSLIERRTEAFANGGPFEWSFAETLAFGSLLMEGKPVRLSGQDSRRGTFSQRQSVFYDAETAERYIPLNHITEPGQQATFCVYNSPLSETAVCGFDYGYSLDYPDMLCLWEGQFGDFGNGAQVIIDQFIVSAESKWQRPSGIVLLLPHGYEGQGPEHSSARLERFLQLCAENNVQVANLTTPAQYFHLLRRQMMRPFRKPLILMTPKSLLRSERAVSRAEDFTGDTRFHEILETAPAADRVAVEHVILCSGKVYYDLLAYAETSGQLERTAFLRVEQLYPLNVECLRELLAPYTAAGAERRIVWCQEEPKNMGAWTFIAPRLEELLGRKPLYAGRPAAASPAVGAKKVHDLAQRRLVEEAFKV